RLGRDGRDRADRFVVLTDDTRASDDDLVDLRGARLLSDGGRSGKGHQRGAPDHRRRQKAFTSGMGLQGFILLGSASKSVPRRPSPRQSDQNESARSLILTADHGDVRNVAPYWSTELQVRNDVVAALSQSRHRLDTGPPRGRIGTEQRLCAGP